MKARSLRAGRERPGRLLILRLLILLMALPVTWLLKEWLLSAEEEGQALEWGVPLLALLLCYVPALLSEAWSRKRPRWSLNLILAAPIGRLLGLAALLYLFYGQNHGLLGRALVLYLLCVGNFLFFQVVSRAIARKSSQENREK